MRSNPRVKIATYNINGVNGHLPVLLRWLAESRPDIACLQETRSPDEKFPHAAIRAAGYEVIWHGQPRWNGVAILARRTLAHRTLAHGIETGDVRRGLPGDPDDTHSRYIEATVNAIRIGCLYLPNGNGAPEKFDYKLRWLRRLSDHAADLRATGQPVVLAGDFNIVPTDLDACVPSRWVHDAVFQPEPRRGYAGLLAQGWTDALRHLHPDESIFTYWDFFYGRPDWKSGLRMDHLLVSPDLRPRVRAAGVDKAVRTWEKTSDHAPAWIELAD